MGELSTLDALPPGLRYSFFVYNQIPPTRDERRASALTLSGCVSRTYNVAGLSAVSPPFFN